MLTLRVTVKKCYQGNKKNVIKVDSKNVIPMSIPFIVILTGILFTVIPNGAKRSKELIFSPEEAPIEDAQNDRE